MLYRSWRSWVVFAAMSAAVCFVVSPVYAGESADGTDEEVSSTQPTWSDEASEEEDGDSGEETTSGDEPEWGGNGDTDEGGDGSWDPDAADDDAPAEGEVIIDSEDPDAEDDGHRFSISAPPFLFLSPLLELTGEFRLTDKMGFAGILGGGLTSELEDVTDPSSERANLMTFRFGGQANFYALGDFDHGLQAGIEVKGEYLRGEVPWVNDVMVTTYGVTPATYLGYKFAASFGLTFMIQLGLGYAIVNAEVEGDDNVQVEVINDGLTGMGTLNMGWSF